MASKKTSGLPPLLNAIAFAARAHSHQTRKDGVTPYVSHAFRVALICRDVFAIHDRQVLTAAVLHDVIEDTITDRDDLAQYFGPEVATWVAMLSKDKRLPHADREKAYVNQISNAPWQVQVCKLADIYDNLIDTAGLRSEQRMRTLRNARRYLRGLKAKLSEEAHGPFRAVSHLLVALGGGKRRRSSPPPEAPAS